MGPSSTYTPLHRDVCEYSALLRLDCMELISYAQLDASYSWSTNIAGRKRWWLFPPEVTGYISKENGEVIPDVRQVDEEEWPQWHAARTRALVIEQEEGETIFV